MLHKQTRRFISAVTDSIPEVPDDVVMQDWINKPLIRQEALLFLNTSPFEVKVDRSAEVRLLRGSEALHSELQNDGPDKFDLRVNFNHCFQDENYLSGYSLGKVYKYFLNQGFIRLCLNLADGQAIQAKGQAVFRDLFENALGIKILPLWKSAVILGSNDMRIPCLSIYEVIEGVEDRYEIRWFSSTDNFVGSRFLTLLFK